MSKDMKSDYEKALKLYHKGKLKKALDCCEKGISKNLKNNSVLNLKGLILYLEGDLEGAITVWKINKDFNDDEMSKTYIRDAENDSEREKEFIRAKIFIKDLHINDAIESLYKCAESDFNSIQVNNELAVCFFKKGDYIKSREYINKSLAINKSDKNTINIKKELDNFTGDKNNKRPIIFIIILAIICTSLISIFNLRGKGDNRLEEEIIINNTQKENKEKENVALDIDNQPKNVEEVKKVEEKQFTPQDIEDYYIKASTYYDEENYLGAKDSLTKIDGKIANYHLNDDILFLLGSTYEKLGENENYIKSFEQYINSYENGHYIQEVYYKLALYYRRINIEKSKSNAQKLADNYPNSIYNNDNIDSILTN